MQLVLSILLGAEGELAIQLDECVSWVQRQLPQLHGWPPRNAHPGREESRGRFRDAHDWIEGIIGKMDARYF